MTVEAPHEPAGSTLMLRIARAYMKPHWKGLAISVACAAGAAGCTFLFAAVLQPAIDGMTLNQPASAVWLVVGEIAAIGLARGIFQSFQIRVSNKVGHSVVGDMQVDMIGRLVRADLARLRSVHSGQFVSSMLYDASLIREAATSGAVNWVREALTLIALMIYMASVDFVLTICVLVMAPVAARLIRTFSKRTTRAATGAMAETSALSTAILESLDGVKIVKLENRESYQEQRVGDVVRRRQGFLIKGSNAKGVSAPVTETLMTFIIAGIIGYATWRASHGSMTAGAFTSFLTALIMAGQSIRLLTNMQTLIAEAAGAAKRLFGALEIKAEVRDDDTAKPLPDGPGHLRFDNVGFRYGEEGAALDGVTIEARRGETIALVGPSGGGKSTILNLIPRFYDVTSGAITIDGHDIRKVTLASLRDRIALVTQEPFLFDETIRDNIAYGRPGATDEEIERAARAAAAHDFITAMNDGYQSMGGEAGGRLSGGQRQRIAIARAFLKDAPILLLDEATSALDTESEAQVQAALERLMAGRTTIMIAHRLSTVQNADRIYVIDGGRVVETGDHAGLIAQGGLYARLAAAQNLQPGAAEG
jgi:subfamily B ATP-binding cassette protein MsbA